MTSCKPLRLRAISILFAQGHAKLTYYHLGDATALPVCIFLLPEEMGSPEQSKVITERNTKERKEET